MGRIAYHRPGEGLRLDDLEGGVKLLDDAGAHAGDLELSKRIRAPFCKGFGVLVTSACGEFATPSPAVYRRWCLWRGERRRGRYGRGGVGARNRLREAAGGMGPFSREGAGERRLRGGGFRQRTLGL